MAIDSTPHASIHDAANQAGSFSFLPMKPALSYDEQLQRIRERGLIVSDEAKAISWLSDTNYYRIRGYWSAFEHDGTFMSGTALDDIMQAYQLDQGLRLWLWHAIGPIEIKARTSLAYHLGMACGPLAHEDPNNFISTAAHFRSVKGFMKELERAKRNGVPCVVHNLNKYGDLPIWAAVEIMSMGTVSQMYGNLSNKAAYSDGTTVAKAVARDFAIKQFHLKSWLRHLTYIRNLCGHHSRIYNRTMTTKATLLKVDAAYDGPKTFPTVITLMRMYERLWPEKWIDMSHKLASIVDTHSSVPIDPLGFPDDWETIICNTQFRQRQ